MARPDLEKRLKVLELVSEGLYLTKIAKVLKISTVATRKLIKKLEKEGYLKQTSRYPAMYKLTGKGKLVLIRKSFKPLNFNQSSPPVSDGLKSTFFTSTNLHDFKVKIPIIEHGSLEEKTKKVKINNWVKEYMEVNLPYPLTLEVTTKNVILHFKQVELPKGADFYQALFRFFTIGLISVVSYLSRRGFKLDLFNLKVISQHIANKTNEKVDKQIPDGTVIEVGLQRIAKTMVGELGNKQEAKAWIDKSQNIAEVETNDLTYEEKLILMPEKIDKLEKNLTAFFYGIDKYSRNIELHLNVLEEMRIHLSELANATKELTQAVKKLAKK